MIDGLDFGPLRGILLSVSYISSYLDSWFWLFDDKGDFSVRSCYRKLRGERECPDRCFWNKLWHLKLPGKVVNFLWRTCVKCLPTTVALVTKNVNVNRICSRCQLYEETENHVLFECSFAIELWESVGLRHLVAVGSQESAMQVLRRAFQLGSMEQVVMFGLLCWNLWNRRNCWVWDRINMFVFGVRARAYNMLADWNKAKEETRKFSGQQRQGGKVWCKPLVGWIKINTYATCLPGMSQVGVGRVTRDESGRFLRAMSAKVQGQGQLQPREAEAIALREALSWIKPWQNRKCIFECDAKLVVDAMTGGSGNSYFHMIIDDCKNIIKHLDEVLVVFTHRSANSVAHLLARVTYSMSGLEEWLDTAPNFILCNLASEEV